MGLSRAEERARKREYSVAFSVSDEKILRIVQDVVSAVMSVPESERAGVYRSLERVVRQKSDTFDGYHYDMRLVSSKVLRLMEICWREWPPQEESGRGSE